MLSRQAARGAVIALLTLACLPGLAGARQGTEDARPNLRRTIVSQEGRFSIEMPPITKRESLDLPSPFGTAKAVIQSAEGSVPVYFVMYADYPASKIGRASPDEVLRRMTSAIRDRPGWTVLKDQKTTVLGHPARDIVARKGPAEVVQRHVLVGNRLYALNMSYGAGRDFRQDVARFLGSFRLLPKPGPRPASGTARPGAPRRH